MGTEQLPEEILAVMQSQSILWPEGTPIAGTPLLRAVRLSVDGVSVKPTPGAQVFSDFVAKVTGPVGQGPADLLEGALDLQGSVATGLALSGTDKDSAGV